MGFWSGLKNFGSKILGGISSASKWLPSTLHKVLGTVAGPIGMINPAIGGALGTAS
jgi:hypothetical protein